MRLRPDAAEALRAQAGVGLAVEHGLAARIIAMEAPHHVLIVGDAKGIGQMA